MRVPVLELVCRILPHVSHEVGYAEVRVARRREGERVERRRRLPSACEWGAPLLVIMRTPGVETARIATLRRVLPLDAAGQPPACPLAEVLRLFE